MTVPVHSRTFVFRFSYAKKLARYPDGGSQLKEAFNARFWCINIQKPLDFFNVYKEGDNSQQKEELDLTRRFDVMLAKFKEDHPTLTVDSSGLSFA